MVQCGSFVRGHHAVACSADSDQFSGLQRRNGTAHAKSNTNFPSSLQLGVTVPAHIVSLEEGVNGHLGAGPVAHINGTVLTDTDSPEISSFLLSQLATTNNLPLSSKQVEITKHQIEISTTMI